MVDPVMHQIESATEYDSWVTISHTTNGTVDAAAIGSQATAYSQIGADFSTWSLTQGISAPDGAVYLITWSGKFTDRCNLVMFCF